MDNHIINSILSDPQYVFNEDQQSIELLIRVGSINTNYLEANKKLLFNGKFQFNLGFLFSKHGNRESLAWLISAKQYPWDNRVLKTLAERGDFESFFWAKSMGCPWGVTPKFSGPLASSLKKHSLYDCVEHWYNKKDFPDKYGEDTMVVLARCGRIEDIESAISLGCPYNDSCKEAMLHEAAKRGRIDIFQWVMKNIPTKGSGNCYGSVWEFAFEDPRLRFMNWISYFVSFRPITVSPDPKSTNDSDASESNALVSSRPMPLLVTVPDYDSESDSDDSECYEESGNFICGKVYARYVHRCWRYAVEKGNSNFLLLALKKAPHFFFHDPSRNWIFVENSTTERDQLLRKIAEHGQLHLAQDVYQHYGPYLQSMMSAEIFSIVASTGRLDFLIWLRECECPWNKEAYESAAYGGHLEIIRWLDENGCPQCDTLERFDSIFSAKERFYHRLSCSAAKGRQLHVLKWSHGQTPLSNLEEVCGALGYRESSDGSDSRACEIFKWLYEEVDSNFFR